MVSIRIVKLKEILKVRNLLEYTARASYDSILPNDDLKKILNAWFSLKNLRIDAKNPSIYFAVAKTHGERIVGVVQAEKKDTTTIHLIRLYVHPEYQKQGIGKGLMNNALLHLHFSIEEGHKIYLEILENNHRAYTFYLSQGFTVIGNKTDNIAGKQIDKIVMEKVISREPE